MFVRSRSPRSGVGGFGCGRTGDGDSNANASRAKLTPVSEQEPAAGSSADGVWGAFHGGVAATRGVVGLRVDGARLLRAESRRSASASARSRRFVASLFCGVVGVSGAVRSQPKQGVSVPALIMLLRQQEPTNSIEPLAV